MTVYLKKNIKSRIINGHPWVYDNEIEKVVGDPEPGAIIPVLFRKTFIGKGYYNPHSVIRLRLLTRKDEEINKSFFARKITQALNYRTLIFDNATSYRLVFGEADGLLGLIVDKFSDYLVIQINTLGIYMWRNDIFSILINIFQPKGIFEKDDEKSARKERFTPIQEWVHGDGPELIPFEINGILFLADTCGQKTGFFLDQRINALNTIKYAENKTVLDAFAYTGNFGLHALKGNTRLVTFVDYSPKALEVLEETLKINKVDKSKYEIINADTFEYLRDLDKAGEKFDLTIIDPPSLAKARESKQNALKGYKELNLRAMKITQSGGFLSTSSCTQHIYEDDFRRVIYSSAENTRKKLTILYKGMQSPDHPIVANIFETEYLKHYVLKVDNQRDF
jgi:23S rRNA (cytosine1962-C5)-methyltransferase